MKKAVSIGLSVLLLLGACLAAHPACAEIVTPAPLYIEVGIRGFYYADIRKAIERINEIRQEACLQGIANPDDPLHPLQPSDYEPIIWSASLEKTARLRAAEAIFLNSHTRPNDQSCFSVGEPYEGVQSEVLAWNHSQNMVAGVNQFYAEKSDWVNQTGKETGHYEALIRPANRYVGLGGFYSDECGKYPSCLCGRFSSASPYNNETYGRPTDTQTVPVEINKNHIQKAILKSASAKENILTVQDAAAYELFGTDRFESNNVLFLDDVEWWSSDDTVATVSNGVVQARKTGAAVITASWHEFSASVTVTVQNPDEPSVPVAPTPTHVTPGDLNGDQQINAGDALLVLKASVGKAALAPEQIAAADLNHDNRVDPKDALMILKIAVGKAL